MADDEALADPDAELPRGSITFAHLSVGTEDADAPADLFDEEERPPKRLVLVVMVEEDAPDLVAALESEAIGARLGERTDDGGVEVLIHDTKLAAAQAVLVEFTGDASLVDAVVEAEDQPETPGDEDDGEDAFVEVVSGRLTGMSSQLERLRAEGIDVRVETGDDEGVQIATAVLMVHPDDLERARAILGIAV
jgi:hypothetical protein